MTDYPTEWVEKVVSAADWGPGNEALAEDVLAAVCPLLRAATLREAADRLDAEVYADKETWGSMALRSWAEEG